jgi:hypothetical protein
MRDRGEFPWNSTTLFNSDKIKNSPEGQYDPSGEFFILVLLKTCSFPVKNGIDIYTDN